MSKRIITISREFGSGGRELGRRLSELLNIAYYDQEIITEISRRTDLAERYIEQVIEQKPIPAFPLHIGRSLYPLSNPIYEQRQAVMLEQNRIIREMAKRSSCVIVGRCGDHILEDVRPFRIFVYAELEHRIARCMERRTAEEVYSLEEMKQKVISVDKNRRKYYEYYTGNLFHPLNGFKQPCSAGYLVGLQGGRHRKADGFLGAGGICHYEIGGQGVQMAVYALHRGIETFQVDCQIGARRCHTSALLCKSNNYLSYYNKSLRCFQDGTTILSVI